MPRRFQFRLKRLVGAVPVLSVAVISAVCVQHSEFAEGLAWTQRLGKEKSMRRQHGSFARFSGTADLRQPPKSGRIDHHDSMANVSRDAVLVVHHGTPGKVPVFACLPSDLLRLLGPYLLANR
jgi:hypothetical protein